ncbi:MFS transporter [Porticoccaceae bacterium]|nr:MFS transporter [Porticoccaceae bacterium]
MLYASPAMGTTFIISSMNIVQSLYAKYFGIGLGTIATILLLSRIFDAFTDPLIGHFSDRYQARHGTRKPFMIAGVLLLIVATFFLLIPGDFAPMTTVSPSDTDSNPMSPANFAMALLAMGIAVTLFDIPHNAWGSEIAPSAQEKNRLFLMRIAAGSVGLLLFFTLPLLPFFDTRDITPQTLQWAFMVGAVILLPLLFFSMKNIPNGAAPEALATSDDQRKKRTAKGDSNWRLFFTTLSGNRPFKIFLLAIVMVSIAGGMLNAMLFFFIDVYLGMGDQFALLSAIGWFFSLLSLWLSYQLFTHLGKNRSWVILLFLEGGCLLIYTQLKPGGDNFLPVLAAITLFNAAFGAIWALASAQLSHIIDYDTLKTGKDRAATFFAIHLFNQKVMLAIGAALAFAVASWFGFDATATVHSEKSAFGVLLAMVYLPVLCLMLAIIFVRLNPLTDHRNRVIRRRLDARIARAKRNHRDSEKRESIANTTFELVTPAVAELKPST